LQDCYFLSVIARTLKREGIAYRIYDIRKPPEHFDPKSTPAVVLSPYQEGDGLRAADLDKLLRRYVADGGKILFVGGSPSYPFLTPLADSFARSPGTDRHDYPLEPREMRRAKIKVAERIRAGRTTKERVIVRVMSDFDTRGSGRLVLKPDVPKNVSPILYLEA